MSARNRRSGARTSGHTSRGQYTGNQNTGSREEARKYPGNTHKVRRLILKPGSDPLLAIYIGFLKKEFSEENVLFWLACEDFKKIHEKDQMQKKARKIYTTFLSSKATAQVNVDGQSRISEEMLQDPHPLMFLMLQEQIYNLMKYDSYQRFLKSDAFLVLSRSEDDERPAVGAGESAPKRASRIYNT
uniref:RGS domain-containing protein n=1 Tax=Leptobrachium leishanense TaxID=445787 RepID=A0A8C5QKL4_9ANUR